MQRLNFDAWPASSAELLVRMNGWWSRTPWLFETWPVLERRS